MYEVLEFLWRLPSYKPSIETLCQQVMVAILQTCVITFLSDC